MKKNLLFLLMAVFTLGFTACSDDDDETPDYAKKIAGTYNGNVVVSVKGNETPVPNQNVDIKKVDENTVTLELKDFKFASIELGDIKIDDVKIKHTGDKNEIVGSGIIKKDVLGSGNEMTLNVNISGTITGNDADITIGVENEQLTAIMGIISVKFTGKK